MEKDLFLKQFAEIEEKVSRLIQVVKAQEAAIEAAKNDETANEQLKTRIAELEQELQGKIEEEKQYQDERSLIRSKIDSLLAKLEEIPEGG